MDYVTEANIFTTIETNYYADHFILEWDDNNNSAGLRPKDAEEFVKYFTIQVWKKGAKEPIEVTSTTPNDKTPFIADFSYTSEKNSMVLCIGRKNSEALLTDKDTTITIVCKNGREYQQTYSWEVYTLEPEAEKTLSAEEKTWVHHLRDMRKIVLKPVTCEMEFRVIFDDNAGIGKVRPQYLQDAITGSLIMRDTGSGQYVDFTDQVKITEDNQYKGIRVISPSFANKNTTYHLKFENLPGKASDYKLTLPTLKSAVSKYYSLEIQQGTDGVWELHFKLVGSIRDKAWLVWDSQYYRLLKLFCTVSDVDNRLGFRIIPDPPYPSYRVKISIDSRYTSYYSLADFHSGLDAHLIRL